MKRRCRAVTVVLAATFWALHARSQPVALRFEHVQGSFGMVNGFARDRMGQMWVASNGGVKKFDGYDTTEYRQVPGDTTSLADNYVRAILNDSQGRLWAGTSEGLNLYDPRTDRFSTFLPGQSIRHLSADRDGKLWLSANSGLFHFDPATLQYTHYTHRADDPLSLAPSQVIATCVAHDGQVWVATNLNGLDRFDPAGGIFHHYRADGRNPLCAGFSGERTIRLPLAGQPARAPPARAGR